MNERESSDNTRENVSIDTVVQLAAGLLSGSGISHQDTKMVSALAVKHAYALVQEMRRASEVERLRLEEEKGRAAREKKSADEKFEKDKKASEEKMASEIKKLEEEKKIRDEEISAQEASRVEEPAKAITEEERLSLEKAESERLATSEK